MAYYYAKADELGRKNMQPAYDALEELENCEDRDLSLQGEIYSREFGFSGSPVCCRYVGNHQVWAR